MSDSATAAWLQDISRGAGFGIFSEILLPSFSTSGRCKPSATAFVPCSAEPCLPARRPPEGQPCPTALLSPFPHSAMETRVLGQADTGGLLVGAICSQYFCCFNSWWHFSGFQTPFLPTFPNELKHSGSLFCLWFWEWTHCRPLFCNCI